MRFQSTRGGETGTGFADAVMRGIASDGGLYVPESLPSFEIRDFDGLDTLPEIGNRLLRPFIQESELGRDLPAICEEAFNFPVPATPVEKAAHFLEVLELFHGPTAAFKDVGARFLAACMERLNRGAGRPLTILVATSGDTGGAVAAAFHGRPNIRVVVLFPKGLVSPRQEQQLTCWGGNVSPLAVEGTFDDCQRLVKEAFADRELTAHHRLTSANSINLGRLLPQSVYYAASSLDVLRRTGAAASYIVPTGNLGNAQACVWARAMGLPIGRIVLATNANRPIPDFLDSGHWEPRPSIATLASAMDVGNPSNMERLRWLYRDDIDALRHAVDAVSVSDAEISDQIARDCRRYDRVWCPHTATAMHVYDGLSEAGRRDANWLVVATAHPAKFETIVEPLIGKSVEVPQSLASLLDLPSHAVGLKAELGALGEILDGMG